MAFIERGISGAEIARNLGVTRFAICKTLTGEIKSYRIRKAIAEAIGVKVDDLWPRNGESKN